MGIYLTKPAINEAMSERKVIVGRRKEGKCGKCGIWKVGNKLNNVIIERDGGNDEIYPICKSCIRKARNEGKGEI